MRRELLIDSMVGGMGDIWMRLWALYSLLAIVPEVSVTIRIPASLSEVAAIAWPDRMEIATTPIKGAIQISHLGLRHLVPEMLKGQRFLSPFISIQAADRKTVTAKHRLNDCLFGLAASGGLTRIPLAATVNDYQGFHEFSGLAEFRRIGRDQFLRQALSDAAGIRGRLQARWTPRGSLPLVILPSGSAHQIMPAEWAATHFPDAVYAFHARDDYQLEFQRRSLCVIHFESVAELMGIFARADRVIATDSFPSHPAQAYSERSIIVLTQQPRGRIVHPSFEGPVVDSMAACHPCSNRARGFGKCDAGHEFCLSWQVREYAEAIREACL